MAWEDKNSFFSLYASGFVMQHRTFPGTVFITSASLQDISSIQQIIVFAQFNKDINFPLKLDDSHLNICVRNLIGSTKK